MRNIFKMFLIMIMMVTISFANVSMAANMVVKSVAVTGIETPYSEERVLDTTADVEHNVPYRVTEVAWKTPALSSTGLYEVTVTLKPSIGYTFSEDVTGTINGNSVISSTLVEEDELKITYAFPEQGTSIGTSTVTLRHRISTYCDEEKGTISPYIIRVLHGDSQTVTITPKEGYRISDVKVDGESVGAVSEYRFRKVKENHTIRAYFEEIEEDSVDENGKVDEIEKNRPILNFIKTILELIKM